MSSVRDQATILWGEMSEAACGELRTGCIVSLSGHASRMDKWVLASSVAQEVYSPSVGVIKCAVLTRRRALSLYTHISNITWNYSNPGRSAGTVSDRSEHDIRSFDVDADEAATFAGVNRLWELVN